MLKKILTLLLFLHFITFPYTALAKIPSYYGANGALLDENISLADALTYALQDELLHQSYFDSCIERYGAIRPFVQVKVYQSQQISTLLPLLKKYNIDSPKDRTNKFIHSPPTLQQAFEQAIEYEIKNNLMYKKLRSINVFPEDVTEAFERFFNSSSQHIRILKSEKKQYVSLRS